MVLKHARVVDDVTREVAVEEALQRLQIGIIREPGVGSLDQLLVLAVLQVPANQRHPKGRKMSRGGFLILVDWNSFL